MRPIEWYLIIDFAHVLQEEDLTASLERMVFSIVL